MKLARVMSAVVAAMVAVGTVVATPSPAFADMHGVHVEVQGLGEAGTKTVRVTLKVTNNSNVKMRGKAWPHGQQVSSNARRFTAQANQTTTVSIDLACGRNGTAKVKYDDRRGRDSIAVTGIPSCKPKQKAKTRHWWQRERLPGQNSDPNKKERAPTVCERSDGKCSP